MALNPIKEQRKIAQKYVIGYSSDKKDFEDKLKSYLSNSDLEFELIDLSALDNDTLSLYLSILDEIILDGNLPKNFDSFLKELQNAKPFIRVIGLDSVEQLKSIPDIDTETMQSQNFDILANYINSRAKLIINIKKLQTQSREKSLKFIMQLVSILENKDPYTKDHSARVAKYSQAIAEEYFAKAYDEKYGSTKSQNPEQYEKRKHEFVIQKTNLVILAAWAHDIGKNSIAATLLNKDSKLTDSEYDMMKMHADFGAEMIRKILGDEEFAEAIENHHERIDGQGYHHRDEFSDISKIIAIADSLDAMTTTRPYTTKIDDESKNKLKTVEEAINELLVSSHFHMDINENKMSQQLDTQMTDILVKLLKKDLSLIKEGNLEEVTLLNGGIDENGYVKAGFWDDKAQLYVQDRSVSGFNPKFIN